MKRLVSLFICMCLCVSVFGTVSRAKTVKPKYLFAMPEGYSFEDGVETLSGHWGVSFQARKPKDVTNKSGSNSYKFVSRKVQGKWLLAIRGPKAVSNHIPNMCFRIVYKDVTYICKLKKQGPFWKKGYKCIIKVEK